MKKNILKVSLCGVIVVLNLHSNVFAAQSTCSTRIARHIEVSSADISVDGNKLALAYTDQSDEAPKIEVFDLESGRRITQNILLGLRLPKGLSSIRWDYTTGKTRLVILRSGFNAVGYIYKVDIAKLKMLYVQKCLKCMVFDISRQNDRVGLIQQMSKLSYSIEIRDKGLSGGQIASLSYPHLAFLNEVSLSPKGDRIAFTAAHNEGSPNALSLDLHQIVYDISSNQFYTLPQNTLQPTWFSNDQLFVLGENDHAIYIQDIVVGKRQKFADVEIGEEFNSISGVMVDPQSRRAVILVKTKTGFNDLYVFDTQCRKK